MTGSMPFGTCSCEEQNSHIADQEGMPSNEYMESQALQASLPLLANGCPRTHKKYYPCGGQTSFIVAENWRMMTPYRNGFLWGVITLQDWRMTSYRNAISSLWRLVKFRWIPARPDGFSRKSSSTSKDPGQIQNPIMAPQAPWAHNLHEISCQIYSAIFSPLSLEN